jgi:hypothetical protein
VEHWIRSRFATLPASEVIGALYHVMRDMTHAGRSSRAKDRQAFCTGLHAYANASNGGCGLMA